jgi:hypothetical protein
LISVRICTAQLGVEIGQRLVEQEHLGVADDRPAHGHALPLSAGQLARITVEIRREAEDVGGLLYARADVLLRPLASMSANDMLSAHGHVRIEGVVLEHHRDVALLGRHPIDHGAADRDLAGADFLQPGDHPQECRLAAPGRAHQDAELAVGDRNVDAADNVRRTEVLLHCPEYPHPPSAKPSSNRSV